MSLAALERAVRFGAFSLAAVRRILAAQARPKPLLDELAELQGDALDPRLREDTDRAPSHQRLSALALTRGTSMKPSRPEDKSNRNRAATAKPA